MGRDPHVSKTKCKSTEAPYFNKMWSTEYSKSKQWLNTGHWLNSDQESTVLRHALVHPGLCHLWLPLPWPPVHLSFSLEP